jgi:Ca-activated chloride channel family protein
MLARSGITRPGITLLVAFMVLTALSTALTTAQDTSDRSKQRPRKVSAPSVRPQQSSTPNPDEGEADVVRVETNLVNTVFTAVDHDRHFITTLRADDLRIFENDTPQDISLFERETERPLTIVILVDTSKSQERTLADEKKAAKAFIKSVVRPEKDKVAVVSFTGKPTIEQSLTDQMVKLNRSIDRLKVELPGDNPDCEAVKSVQEDPLCWTSIWDAAWASTNDVLAHTPENSRRAIILLSDGDDTSSTIKRQDAIESAVKNNVIIYSIGIGDPESYKVEADSLRKLSDRTGGRAFIPRDERELGAAFDQIQTELRSQYVLAEE